MTFRRTNIKNSSMDFTKVLNEFWFNIILGFNSTFLSGLDMLFTKNGFGVHQDDIMSYHSSSCYVWLSLMAHCVPFSVQHVKSGLICLFLLLFKK